METGTISFNVYGDRLIELKDDFPNLIELVKVTYDPCSPNKYDFLPIDYNKNQSNNLKCN